MKSKVKVFVFGQHIDNTNDDDDKDDAGVMTRVVRTLTFRQTQN